MNFERLITKIQTILGISKPELMAVLIILSGVVLAFPVRHYYANQSENNYNSTEFYATIDSLAEVSRSSYIGSTVDGKSDSLLAMGDTIIEKPSFFGSASKKEIPTGTKISLNNASKTELMKLPGVGESTAIKIIEYRSASKFNKISDLMNIKGIGEKKFEKIKPYIIL